MIEQAVAHPYFADHPWLATLLSIAVLAVLAWVVNFVTRAILRFVLRKQLALQGVTAPSQRDLPQMRAISRIAHVAPVIVVMAGIHLVPGLSEVVVQVTRNVCSAILVLTIALAVGHLLDYVNLRYMRTASPERKPIKGYIQLGKLVVYIIAALLVISTLIDKSPLILLSGLGAMAAVLMLIFQDTILSLVASVQISSSGAVRVGDWLEMPQVNADGDVVDIALHTVTVQNWDKTLTTFPTRKLVSDSFKNWRGMTESGGRRIKRSLYLDQTSVRFMDENEVASVRHFAVLDDYLAEKEAELSRWNESLHESGRHPINNRRVTNIGTFRAYVQQYLEKHPQIRQDMTLLVRQLQPTAEGIPLEIYCFTATTSWGPYEDIQSDIFDHLLAILPQFDLRVFQQPTGADVLRLGQSLRLQQ
ncbi:mechanosensitive ion channel family protein [Isoalcanivorax beigongshangi]|uniref:Mechanosensitive ion channel family protein n=1 Tax=Isoalcanivorax beigongshangi TaxID=3238810 RepID=A0ABV4ADI2_9GAMM